MNDPSAGRGSPSYLDKGEIMLRAPTVGQCHMSCGEVESGVWVKDELVVFNSLSPIFATFILVPYI